jgi:hypothetical protein
MGLYYKFILRKKIVVHAGRQLKWPKENQNSIKGL